MLAATRMVALAVVGAALSFAPEAEARWPAYRSSHHATHRSPAYMSRTAVYRTNISSGPLFVVRRRGAPGYEYQSNRYEARTTGGFNRLYSF